MQDPATESIVHLDRIQTLLGEHGYDVQTTQADGSDDQVLQVRDPESSLTIRCVLEDNILFNTIHCATIARDKLTPEVLFTMVDAENGISTSSFQVYDLKDGTVSLALNNFCKLQSLGDDDEDDILSCLEFLAIDAYAARGLLGDKIA